MGAVKLSTIRSRFGSAIDAIAGMSISRNPYERFGAIPNTVAHLRFAIGIISCDRIDSDRQKENTGIYAQTIIGIKFAYRLRPKDQITSYDEGFDKSNDLIKACTNRSPAIYTNLQIYFDNQSHEISDSGEYLIITIRFLIYHFLPLN